MKKSPCKKKKVLQYLLCPSHMKIKERPKHAFPVGKQLRFTSVVKTERRARCLPQQKLNS